MKYTILSRAESPERYVWEDGVLKKKYVVSETDDGVYLADTKTINATVQPKFFLQVRRFPHARRSRSRINGFIFLLGKQIFSSAILCEIPFTLFSHSFHN